MRKPYVTLIRFKGPRYYYILWGRYYTQMAAMQGRCDLKQLYNCDVKIMREDRKIRDINLLCTKGCYYKNNR